MTPLLRRLVHGQLASHQLPPTLPLCDLEAEFGALRRNVQALTAQQQVEWGSCIVLQDERLLLLHPVRGWQEGVNPGCRPMDRDHGHYVRFAHTHLPDGITGRP
jgi:hypothetical protein